MDAKTTKSKKATQTQEITFEKQAKIISVIGTKYECNVENVQEGIKELSDAYDGLIDQLVEYVDKYKKNPKEYDVKQVLDYIDNLQTIKKSCDSVLNDFEKLKK